MRIAIIGAGISGNVCAYRLSRDHEVTLFEAGHYAGGHTNTIDVEAYGQPFAVDTGFMVFNDRTYPQFVHLLEELGVPSQNSDMSFSVHCERTGFEYQGSSLNGLFAQRRNLVDPRFYRMVADILRFNRHATRVRDELDDHETLGQFLARSRYAQQMVAYYLLPMTAAIWSASPSEIADMPARFLFQFFHNHGLLQLRDRPQWKTIRGGARQYVEKLLRPLGDRVRLSTPILSVRRQADRVELQLPSAATETFDAVVFACHADQALRLLDDPSPREREVLGHFRYQENAAVVHTDRRMLPLRRRAWASWNYHIPEDDGQPVAVTYDLNRLQRLQAPGPICVTLNHEQRIAKRHRLRTIIYQHPVFGPGTLRAQQAHAELNGQRGSYYCGAYWGYGFHEDGVRSALAVCQAITRDTGTCTAVSTGDTCGIGDSRT